MVETIRLSPHDPVPDHGHHALVLRHMGEDDPNAIVTEIVLYGTDGSSIAGPPPGRLGDDPGGGGHRRAGRWRSNAASSVSTFWTEPQERGSRKSSRRMATTVFRGEILDDTDAEDGVSGSDIRDRGTDAGFMR